MELPAQPHDWKCLSIYFPSGAWISERRDPDDQPTDQGDGNDNTRSPVRLQCRPMLKLFTYVSSTKISSWREEECVSPEPTCASSVAPAVAWLYVQQGLKGYL